ncbi:uncharacterized protein si:dkey-91i10.2 isoform X2 [Hypomesus transpacificus]|uniref:uncharacterized protein si:dkey-91i10.2 isoform X2 n=1 Tax=Hypomesus transpacificus TaxID=137520 RepID=UPI001F08357E|nr:uncharacterized protein si:dkey-91i10.2 isoform X2 [Hypomesus transpacificus]
MPDVKTASCNYPSSAGPLAGCRLAMDLEPCLTDHPLPLPLAAPLPAYPGHSAAPYSALQGASPSPIPRCNSSALLSNLGLRYCSSSSGPPLRRADGLWPHTGLPPASCNSVGSRLYRSMENLNWNAMAEPSLFSLSTPYRSMDSEFIFRCTATSHWYDGPPEGPQVYGIMPTPESLAFYPRRGPARRDQPLFPQWLFPGVDDWGGNARRGLREKLRLQSARASEPHKPLRPQVIQGAPLILPGSSEREGSPGRFPGGRSLCARRITSPEEIKQEVLRRLQLRRQRSTPNLAAHVPPESQGGVAKSYTAESLCGSGPEPSAERKRPPVGRLHIPTFEEFKRMRQGGGSQRSAGTDPPLEAVSGSGSTAGDREAVMTAPSGQRDSRRQVGLDGEMETKEEGRGGGERTDGGEGRGSDSGMLTLSSPEQAPCQPAIREQNQESTKSPICTGPAPRTPLQPLVRAAPESGLGAWSGPGTGPGAGAGSEQQQGEEEASKPSVSLGPAEQVPFPPRRESSEGPSSCCPALLMEGAHLSSYGAKIYKMKDGFIGSALDLIKKSCSAEISAEAPVRMSGDHDDGADITAPPPACQSSTVSMATTPCGAAGCDEPAGAKEPAECHSGLSCRRSSSDAAYEPAETVRAQRECRLRPHYSDPMPADAAKRKQLEMKIAAAARFHSQRRDRDRDRDRDSAPAALRGRSEPSGEERAGGLRVRRGGQHRWSTVSSLSVDSGVVGLSDEREEEEEPRRMRRGGGGGAEVERVDSGIGPGLARGWKRPSASLRVWEAQRPCPDCGQRDREGMCERCSKLRTERKEAILEFLNTESSYGEDLRIIKEEFYCPMQSAALLSAEQLAVVFSNVQELIDVNERFTEHLQDSIDQAFDQGDEDLLTVCIGEIFLEFVNMLPAFQTYCLQQSTSVNMLNTLEKEKELLRIFLDVSQNDNTALRRMNLRSFLMAPLQRVTKYPLLLSRISKATTECHPDHGRLREAKSRVESHLEHINMKTRQEGAVTWSLRSFRRDSRKNREVINIEMRELSLKTVGWARESTRFVMEGPMQLSQPADGQWLKKGSRALKFQNVQSLLMVRTQRAGEGGPAPVGLAGQVPGCQADPGARGECEPQEPPGESVRDGVLVLIKDKSSGKFAVLREPIRLANCVVSADPECEDTFELLDIRREAFVFRASDKARTQQWFRQIKRYSRDLGPWRKRRNALPNIMINTNQSRS